MPLTAELVAVRDLTPATRDALFDLMDRHYVNVQRSTFDADLADKRWVILLRDGATGVPCGFSTQRLLEITRDGRPIKALFSGDTIMDRAHWGTSALAGAWGRFALSLIDADPGAELYWFLISKGFRTYRFLPVFFHEFYPRHDRPTPAWASQAIADFARARYPDEFDAERGIIRSTGAQYWLREDLAAISPERLTDPHVRYFHERNPGYIHGDELCCLAPLTRGNFTRAAYRVIGAEPVLAEIS